MLAHLFLGRLYATGLNGTPTKSFAIKNFKKATESANPQIASNARQFLYQAMSLPDDVKIAVSANPPLEPSKARNNDAVSVESQSAAATKAAVATAASATSVEAAATAAIIAAEAAAIASAAADKMAAALIEEANASALKLKKQHKKKDQFRSTST